MLYFVFMSRFEDSNEGASVAVFRNGSTVFV